MGTNGIQERNKQKMKKPCSKLFEKIFDSHTGGCRRECVCGRTHFDISSNGWDWNKGELEELQDKAKKDSDRYVTQDGSVGTMAINDVEIVYGCPCNNAKDYENFILRHADQIKEYLNERAKILRAEADRIEMK